MNELFLRFLPFCLLFIVACSKYDGPLSGETICEGFVRDQATGEPVGGLILQFELSRIVYTQPTQYSSFTSFGTINTDENGYFFIRFELATSTQSFITSQNGRIRGGFDSQSGLNTIATFVPGELNHYEIQWP